MTEVERHIIGDALWWSYVSDDGPGETCWVRHEITRVTAKRVYFRDHGRDTYCDRATLEATGRVYRRGGLSLYLDGPEERERREREHRQAWLDAKADNVRALRQAAADAHPDRGGTAEDFATANARYQSAKTAARRWTL